MECTHKRIPQVHCQAAKKNQRNSMEDRHLVSQIDLPGKGMVDIIAVFDGHGGSEVAEELLRVFPEILSKKLDIVTDIHDPPQMRRALRSAFITTDYRLFQGGGFTSGSTAIVAMWPHNDDYLYIGNLGDSRAVVWTTEKLVIETKDHKPSREIDRIKEAKGVVFNGRIAGVLAVSRSFGDFAEGFKLRNNVYRGVNSPLSANPDIYQVNFSKYPGPVRMVLASDGLWDVLNTRSVMRYFNRYAGESSCTDIIEEAVKRGSRDNITVMVVDIPSCQTIKN